MRPLTRLTGQVVVIGSRRTCPTCLNHRQPLTRRDSPLINHLRREVHQSQVPFNNASSSSRSKTKDVEEEGPVIALGAPPDSVTPVEPPTSSSTPSSSARPPSSSTTAFTSSPNPVSDADASAQSRLHADSLSESGSSSPAPTPASAPDSSSFRPESTPRPPSESLAGSATSIVSEWRKTLANNMLRLRRESEKKLTEVGLRINEVTGYSEVERLKAVVADAETSLSTSRSTARAAKQAYDNAVQSRSNAQQQVNILLERKHSWTDTDVSSFTNLVRQDHTSSHDVTTTSEQLRDAESRVDIAFSDLTKAILQRYHEEQVWSDKIRNVSTWVNLAGLVINLVVFVGAIAIVEPWKRKRLVERVEERMTEMIGKVEQEVKQFTTVVAGTLTSVIASSGPEVERQRPQADVTPLSDPRSESAIITPPDRSFVLPDRLNQMFASKAWRTTAQYVIPSEYRRSHPAEVDLAMTGGLCIGVGMAIGTVLSYLIR